MSATDWLHIIERSKKTACNHEWVGNIPVRNNSQDGSAGQHCKHCYKEKLK